MISYKYWPISDFSKGQNNEYDARNLLPIEVGDGAESQLIENMELTQKGAVITSPGYELKAFVPELSNMVGWWQFNEGSGATAVDTTVNANDGTITGASYTTSGKYGTALDFTVMGDNVLIPDNAAIQNIFDGGGSISAWINPGSDGLNGNYGTIVTKDGAKPAGNVNGWDFYVTDDDGSDCKLAFLQEFSTADGGWVTTALDIPLNAWSHVVVTYDNGSTANVPTLYVNGVAVGITAWSGPVGTRGTDVGNDLYIGNRIGVDLTFDGLIDDPRLYDAILTPSQVEAIYNNEDYGSEPIQALANFTYDSSERYLVAAVNDVIYQVDIENELIRKVDNFSNAATYVNMVQYQGSSSTPFLIVATDNTSDKAKKVYRSAANTLSASDLFDPTQGAYVVEEMMGFLFMALDRTLYYCASEDEDDFAGGGTIGFNNRIIALRKTSNDTLIVLMEDNTSQQVTFSFDDTTFLYTPVKDEYMAGTGGIAHKTCASAYDDTLFLSQEGVKYFGQDLELQTDNFRINTLSWQVDPLIKQMNYEYQEVAAGGFFDKEYWLSIPVGDAFTQNNETFIYDYKYESWRYRSGIAASDYAVYRYDTQDELYFGSSTESKINKFVTNDYSYDGTAYRRAYKFKTFNFGTSIIRKDVPYIEIAGSMPEGSEFYVTVTTDGIEQIYKVDDTALAAGAGGGYIGDQVYGHELMGGNFGAASYDFFRFYQRIPLGAAVREGHEFDFEIWYDGEGRPMKFDYFNIKYGYVSEQKVPDNFINNNIIA